MVEKYQGMRAYVEECYAHPTKGWMHISSCMPRIFYPFQYEQLGIYKGNTEGVREGALIEIWFRPNHGRGLAGLKDFYREIIRGESNIVSFKLIENGPDEKGWKAFANGWLRFFGFKQWRLGR